MSQSLSYTAGFCKVIRSGGLFDAFLRAGQRFAVNNAVYEKCIDAYDVYLKDTSNLEALAALEALEDEVDQWAEFFLLWQTMLFVPLTQTTHHSTHFFLQVKLQQKIPFSKPKTRSPWTNPQTLQHAAVTAACYTWSTM